jgi:hypothetical protein
MSKAEIKQKVIEFLKQYPDGNIPDSDVHDFSDQLGINTHELESMFYQLAAKYVNKNENKKLSLSAILREVITIDIEPGDTVKTGKFLNKLVVVKEIGKDEHGSPTINGKSILRIRIPKLENPKTESKMKRTELNTLIENTIRKVLKEQEETNNNLSLEQLKEKYPEIEFTLNPLPKSITNGNIAYIARVDIITKSGEKKYLGAIKGPCRLDQALTFFNGAAKNNYDKYY